MQRFLKVLFGVALMATGILSMLAISVESPTGINARLWFIPAALSAIVIGAIRVWLFRRYGASYRFSNVGHYGLLTHRWRPPLTKLERLLRTAEIAQLVLFIQARKNSKKPWADMGLPPSPDEPEDMVYKQITALMTQWASDRPDSLLSDDECRSINKLHVYANINYDQVKYRQQSLEDVKDIHIFQSLKTNIDAWYVKKNRRQDERKQWLEKIGDPDARHLLKDGWIAFLKSLPGTDVSFWHTIVNEYHDLGGDRLNAVFWILEQPECDRTTAAMFIRGFAFWEVLLSEATIASRNSDWGVIDSYRKVLERWNAGFYQFHTLNPLNYGSANEIDDSPETLQVAFQKAEDEKGMPALPFPKGVFDDLTLISHYKDQVYHSPFDYWDDQGLHLRYPEEWPDLPKTA